MKQRKRSSSPAALSDRRLDVDAELMLLMLDDVLVTRDGATIV
jgi:hypothetical protein